MFSVLEAFSFLLDNGLAALGSQHTMTHPPSTLLARSEPRFDHADSHRNKNHTRNGRIPKNNAGTQNPTEALERFAQIQKNDPHKKVRLTEKKKPSCRKSFSQHKNSE
jgi:hypothetical protein